MSEFKDVIKRIVRSEAESIENEDLYLNIEAESDAIEDLNIERHGDELIVCQYYMQRGDLMRDPEVRFQIQDDGEWKPVSFRDDPYTHKRSSKGLEITNFLSTWAVNLEHQFL